MSSSATLAGAIVASALVLLATSTPLALSFVVSPEDIESGRVRPTPPCPYRESTGAPCVACGLTRAMSALSRGRYDDALRFNPSSPFVYAGLWIGACVAGAVLLRSVRGYRSLRRD